MNFFRPFRTYRPYKFGTGGVPLVFQVLAPDSSTGEMTGVLKGIGGLTTGRTYEINVRDSEGVYRPVPGGNAAWRNARVELDPSKLFCTMETTATSPDPLANFRMDFNDGSTWGIDFGEFYTNRIASGAAGAQSGIPSGSTIKVFAGDAATITLFFCYSSNLAGSMPDLSTNTALFNFSCSANKLTGSIPDLSANTALSSFNCYSNLLTGSVPSLAANTVLSSFYCSLNQLTGSLPDLSANLSLFNFQCYANQLTGSLPDISANSLLSTFFCHVNQLTDVVAGWAWPAGNAINFRVDSNLLTELAVNTILIAADDALTTGAGTTINLGGTGNAAPTGAGITAKASLITKGASMTTN